MNSTENWYAIYTLPRWEKKTSGLLIKKQIESYCPLRKVLRQWADRKKLIFEPIFTSYVFVHVCDTQFNIIRETPGVLNFVYWCGKPAIIKDHEIDTIKKFFNDCPFAKSLQGPIDINDEVRITRGPFMMKEGLVREVKNYSVKIFLPSIGLSMVAEIEKENVDILKFAKNQRE